MWYYRRMLKATIRNEQSFEERRVIKAVLEKHDESKRSGYVMLQDIKDC